MIPDSNIDIDLDIIEVTETTKTYNLLNEDIKGYAEDLKALEQAIYKELSTEKYEYPIYSFDYGIELESLLGKDSTYVKIELKRRIEDCLNKYKEIEIVDNFEITVKGDELTCNFNVKSIYGDLLITKEVSI